MKKYFFIIILSLTGLISLAQKAQFKEAIQRGREPDQFYLLVNSKDKLWTLEGLVKYAASQNYILGNYSMKSINCFGDVADVVKDFEFLPVEEFDSYIFYNIQQGKKFKYSDLTTKGKAFLFGDIYGSGATYFHKDNILWSGALNNGNLHGSGFGFLNYNFVLIYFEGKFDNGIPIGTNYFSWIRNIKKPFNQESVKTYKSNVGKFSEGLASFEAENGLFGFMDYECKALITPRYKSVVTDFQNGLATVRTDSTEIIITKEGNFKDYTIEQKRLFAEAKIEKERKEAAERKAAFEREIARRKAEEEKRIMAINKEKRRVSLIQNAKEGDIIQYYDSFTSEETGFFYSSTIRHIIEVSCYVEKNVNNGERLQVRVAKVYTERCKPNINGIDFYEGKVLWIYPLRDKAWSIQ